MSIIGAKYFYKYLEVRTIRTADEGGSQELSVTTRIKHSFCPHHGDLRNMEIAWPLSSAILRASLMC